MTSPSPLHLLAAIVAISCASCGDDPKLVEQRDKQKAEITRLKGELALIDEKLKTLPPDVSDELAEAKKLSAKQTAEVEALQTEVAALEEKKSALQSEFDAYQVKYQAK
jgi:Skp family chaperone for outer membrane proteins